MLQHILLDLRIGCPILKFGHIHIFQRELNPNLFRVDLTLGKQDNRLEDALDVTMAQRTELDYLIYYDPLGYADLILNGDPEGYLKDVGGRHKLED